MITKNQQPKLAAIYVRVSSEHQAEKASPDEQELECRQLAKEIGLTVVVVYRDIQKYRIGKRLVEPSGTRADRPGLREMLRDAASGGFDTILAWREDRLYRGLKAMILVIDEIQQYHLNVFLARENFDQRMAPVKAWVGQMELDGMHERMTMGVQARLKAGKANTGQDRYGYQRNGEVIEIVEEEAKWVRQIFEWYIHDVKLQEIRRRLIEAGAPQKGSSIPRKVRWARSSIQSILKAAKDYASGIKIFTRDGEIYEIPVPAIIDPATYSRFIELRQSHKTHRARNVQHDYLCSGLVYCPCEKKWQGTTYTHPTRKNRKGEIIPRKTPQQGNYYCPERHAELRHPDCPKTIGHLKLDDYVWGKVDENLRDPKVLMDATRSFVNNLRQKANTTQDEKEDIQKQLDELSMERQWVITQARKKRISEDDMDTQLTGLSIQELDLKRRLARQIEADDIAALEDWEETTREYLSDLASGLKWLNAAPQNNEERHQKFLLKRRLVKLLVEKVEIGKDRQISVNLQLDPLKLLAERANRPAAKVWQVGTYTRTPASPVRRHRTAACG